MTHTPKNIGNGHVQTAFYVNHKGDGKISFKVFKDTFTFNELAEQASAWLNKFVPPHCLISISMFEGDHPNDDGERYIVIAHTAGSDPKELDHIGGIYSVNVH